MAMMGMGNIGLPTLTSPQGSGPNLTGTNIANTTRPAGGMFGMPTGSAGGPAPVRTAQTGLHSSGLPTQPPTGIAPGLWGSILAHLQNTNFQAPNNGGLLGGASPGAPSQQQPWRPLPSPMPQQATGGISGIGNIAGAIR